MPCRCVRPPCAGGRPARGRRPAGRRRAPRERPRVPSVASARLPPGPCGHRSGVRPPAWRFWGQTPELNAHGTRADRATGHGPRASGHAGTLTRHAVAAYAGRPHHGRATLPAALPPRVSSERLHVAVELPLVHLRAVVAPLRPLLPQV